MIWAISPRTAPAEITLRSAATAGATNRAAATASIDARRRIMFPPGSAALEKPGHCGRMRREHTIARRQRHSHRRSSGALAGLAVVGRAVETFQRHDQALGRVRFFCRHGKVFVEPRDRLVHVAARRAVAEEMTDLF